MNIKSSSPSAEPASKAEPAAGKDPEPEPRVLTPAAQRALAEAEARRRAREAKAAAASEAPAELGGQAGPDPTRYGDWEKNGIASDF